MIAPEGLSFLVASAALTALVAFGWPRSAPLSLVMVAVTAWVGWFFRNPTRVAPSGPPGAVVSPADGRIIFSGECPPGRYSPERGKKVSVFMSIFDVHVNRAPVTGKVADVWYNPGRFHVASVDKASLENEQAGVVLETTAGARVAYVQIAGLIARRVVCDLKPGQQVRQGQRVGLIRFGSRVDVFLPAGAQLAVRPGDRVRAGESVIGVLP